MEVVSCKILHSHFCIWLNNDRFHVEDVEAQRSLVISETHPNCFLAEIVELVRAPEDRFFLKFGELDFGRTMLSQFRSENGWVFSGDDEEGWQSFLQLLERFLSNLEYKKWFSSHCLPAKHPSQIQSSSYADKVTSFGFTFPDQNKGFQCQGENEVLQASPVLKLEKQFCRASVWTAAKQSTFSGPQNFHHLSNQSSSYWVHKNNEVFVQNFNKSTDHFQALVFIDWKDIIKTLEEHFQAKICINPVFVDKALIRLPQRNLENLIETPGKWQCFWALSYSS